MSDSLPVVRVLVSKYPVLYQKSNCDNFDDAEEVPVKMDIHSVKCEVGQGWVRRGSIGRMVELLHGVHGPEGVGGGDYVSLTTMYVVICGVIFCINLSCSVPVIFLFLLFQLLRPGTLNPIYGMTLLNFRSPAKPVWISMLCQAAWELHKFTSPVLPVCTRQQTFPKLVQIVTDTGHRK